ncbi:MAG: 3-hydroxyacyl-CoA dehydrogenase/enoyl-CoA hydratase/3-hydroxybutyryl-CoA epimerase, partial [Candidatus Omnitrophota bacterium]
MGLSYRIIKHVAVVSFDHDDSKVNILNSDVLTRLDVMLDEVASKKDVRAVVFMSMKNNCFIAGADIKEIEKIVEPNDGAIKAKAGQDIMNKIEDLKVPTIAVIDGVALGGGCELAIACDYRISTFNEKVRIGLPEVNLGFVPGFGGCYRLPRIVGLQEGLKMILAGRPIDSAKALRIGLFDKLFPQKDLEISVYNFVEDVIEGRFSKEKYGTKKLRGINKILEGTAFGRSIVYKESRKSVMKLSKGFYPAPLKAIDVIEEVFTIDRKMGLMIEREAFGELAVTDISKSLVKVFYMSEKYRKLTPESIKGVEPVLIEKAGVLGAGVMGGGIAQLLSSKDIWTRIKDLNYDALALGLRSASKVYTQAVKKRKFTKAQAISKMDHITTTLNYSGFQSVGIVIEAVLEKMDVKKAVFKELGEKVSEDCVLASNTSALSVTEMAHATKNPSRVIGFHFFNPVHRMPLVEIITTDETSKEALATSLALVKRLGKTPIVCKDSPGFVVNRILLAYMSEAGRILEECGQMEAIDKI